MKLTLGLMCTAMLYVLAYLNSTTLPADNAPALNGNAWKPTISVDDRDKLDKMVFDVQAHWLETQDFLLTRRGFSVNVRRALLDPTINRRSI